MVGKADRQQAKEDKRRASFCQCISLRFFKEVTLSEYLNLQTP
jgi:hypothetical protein